MLTWFRSLFAWRVVNASGVWQYEINRITGKRRAYRRFSGGYTPLNWEWLLAGNGMPDINGYPAWRSAYRNELPDGLYWA